jgi:hypothetical protein
MVRNGPTNHAVKGSDPMYDKYVPIVCGAWAQMYNRSWLEAKNPTDIRMRFSQFDLMDFRWYTTFGMLTDGRVRSGSIEDIVSSEILHAYMSKYLISSRRDFLMMPMNGKFDLNRVAWHLIHKDLVADEDKIREYYEMLDKKGFAKEYDHDILDVNEVVVSRIISYWADIDFHSHNHFSLFALKRMIKSLKKLHKFVNDIKASGEFDSYDTTTDELESVIDQLNGIKRKVKASVMMYCDAMNAEMAELDDRDIEILICFDN